MERVAIVKRPNYWRRRSRLERYLLVFSGMSSLVILAFIVATCLLYKSFNYQESRILNGNQTTVQTADKRISASKLDQSSSITSEQCLSAECIQISAGILEKMNITLDPCDDFYTFACGQYIEKANIPEDKTQVNSFSVIMDRLAIQLRSTIEDPIKANEPKHFKTVKSYYKACLDADRIEKIGVTGIKEYLDRFGGWPVLQGDDWNEPSYNWLDIVYKFRQFGSDIDSIINLQVDMDFKDTSIRLLEIEPPTFGISRRYLVNGRNDDIVKAYFDYMVNIAVFLGAERELALKELGESMDFEIDFAKSVLSEEERRNYTLLYNVYTFDELNKEFPFIPWMEFFNKILPKTVKYTTADNILVTEPKFLKNLESFLTKTPKRILANYQIWIALKALVFYLNADARKIEQNFRSASIGQQERESRWKECISEVTDNFPLLISSLYVRKYFDEHSKATALEMVNFIQAEFVNILKNITWMDEETRKNALDKAISIEKHIAYPNELLDDNKLGELYKDLNVDETEFMYSKLNISMYVLDFDFNKLRKPVNKSDWIEHGYAAVVNAYYQPTENSIMFPAGILQGTFFDSSRPKYLNFAAIGSVIGHEITHGFDDTGSQFDKSGNLIDWWAEDTKEAFLKKAKCIIDQYEKYTLPGIPGHVNGIETQGENIADNGGIKQAYRGYRSYTAKNGPEPRLPGLADFTPEQMFWISSAQIWCSKSRPEQLRQQLITDTHSPMVFRVIGPLGNNEDFNRDWKCKEGDKMNPSKKCAVW